MNPGEVREALRGVTDLVHGAVGPRHHRGGDPGGAHRRAGRGRAAGGAHLRHRRLRPSGRGDRRDPPLTPTGQPYGDSKIAEAVCPELAGRGLAVAILRPTLVHGPFSSTWTITFAQRLQARPWLVPAEVATGTCNLVYVDDLVGAVLAGLEAPIPPGEAFNVNGPERVTWNQYFHALNDAMGLPPLVPETVSRARLSALAVQPFRQTAKFLLRHFQPLIMGAYQRSELARTIMKRAERLIRTTPAPAEFAAYGRRAWYVTAKAERLLGYRPRFPLADALALSAAWLRAHGFVTSAEP